MLRVNHLSGFGRIIPTAGGSYDSDAQAFFTAAGITDTTQKDAVDALVVSLKADGIWTKCTAIYPFVGGSDTAHAVNLKNPGTHDITWNGTVTHDSNGITGNGTDGYGDLNLTPSTHLSEDDTHMSLYSRTSAETGTQRDMGCLSDGSVNQFFMNLSRGGTFQAFCYAGTTVADAANADAQGFYIMTRRSNTDLEAYKNGSSLATDTGADTSNRPSTEIYICCRNVNGTPGSFTNRNYAFASVGDGLSDTEAADFHTAVEAYQDALSRGVV